MRVRTLAVAVALAAAFATASYAQNPVGVWKVNIAKSKYSPGPAPKAGTITTTAVTGGGFKTVNETVPASGPPTKFEVTFKFDGKDNKITGTNPNADMQSYTRVDDHHWIVASKKNGKATLTTKVAVAADGKSRTSTQTGTDAQGRTVNNVIWYDKQ